MKPTYLHSQRGFGYITAIVVLVLLAGFAAAMVRINTAQQSTTALDLESARAYQSAGAGIQWALYMVLRNGVCPAQTTLDLNSEGGLTVVVTCNSTQFNEGEATATPSTPRVKTIFELDAVACNSANCPNNGAVSSTNYVERRRVATACVSGVAPALSVC